MRASQLLIPTLRETPSDAEVISHQLLLRAGMIRRLAAGLYTWLPLGLRVLRKVERIVREEMDRAGAQEVLMPVVQPLELWQETGRAEQYGPELCRLKDRHDRAFCLGPTHEEVITDLARNELKSYKQLPINFYQIQTKFRDEIRPRFGLMRGREFLMKDAYSFHLSQDCLQQTYELMHAAYTRIFTRLGLDFRAVVADTGSIGGSASHEFHVLADSGEDAIAFSDASDYAANVEMAEALAPATQTPSAANAEAIATPDQHSIDDVATFLQTEPARILKTLIVEGVDGLVALVLRGDHELNRIKAEKLPEIQAPLAFASEAAIRARLGCGPGSIGPLNLDITVIADRAAAACADFVCGANRDGFHLRNANWQREAKYSRVADLRNVVDGDPSPDGQGQLRIRRGIEVGHIFQLGDKYSTAMQASVLNEQGREQVMIMGCYGIGVSRVVAAAIEQNHDEHGIRWPAAIAPFQVVLVPLNYPKSDQVREQTDTLYAQLQHSGIEVLLDDRNERPGVKFTDAELIGIPHRVVISDKTLAEQRYEYKHRQDTDSRLLTQDELMARITA